MRSRPAASFIIYQVTNELKQHATIFDHAKSEYFLQNIPPMFITVFEKASGLNGRASIRHRRRNDSPRTPAMTGGGDAHRKGLDGRDVRSGVGPLRCVHPARGPQFPDQSATGSPGHSFARSV